MFCRKMDINCFSLVHDQSLRPISLGNFYSILSRWWRIVYFLIWSWEIKICNAWLFYVFGYFSFFKECYFSYFQDGKALPEGPVVISPDGLFPSLFREGIWCICTVSQISHLYFIYLSMMPLTSYGIVCCISSSFLLLPFGTIIYDHLL